MLHLCLYAKNLGCQQRLEIMKGDRCLAAIDTVDGSAIVVAGKAEGSIKDDVHVKDYLPVLKAICDQFEQADGKLKVVVVADIKQEPSYKGTAGHWAWRNVDAYDSNHVVDSLYRSKYLLTSITSLHEVALQRQSTIHDKDSIHVSDNHEDDDAGGITEESTNAGMIHKVTILIFPKRSLSLRLTHKLKAVHK